MIERFDELVAAAQVGTRKGAPPRVTEFSFDGAERTLLAELGALGLMRRAGAEGVAASPLPPSPPETARVADASTVLDEALDRKAEPAILEWAAKAAQAGFVAPPQSLTGLLRLTKSARRRIVPVLGARGRWLAELMGIDLDDVPEADPRDALREDYESLDYRELVRLVSKVADTATPEDEPILTRAFGDKRKDLRNAAAGGLLRIPGSEPARELRAIAERTIIAKRGLLRRSFEVVPPAPESLPAWLPRGAGRSYGASELALLDVVRRVPLHVWEETTGMKPGELLEAVEKTDYAASLMEGWGWAMIRFRNQAWTDEFFRRGIALSDELIPDVSEDVFDAAVPERFDEEGWRLVSTLRNRNATLSPKLSRVLVDRIRRANSPTYYDLDGIAYLLDLSVLPLFQNPWSEALESMRERWLSILNLRARLLESLR